MHGESDTCGISGERAVQGPQFCIKLLSENDIGRVVRVVPPELESDVGNLRTAPDDVDTNRKCLDAIPGGCKVKTIKPVGHNQADERIGYLIVQKAGSVKIFSGIQPHPEVAIDRRCSWISRRQRNNEVGIDNDGHLLNGPLIEVQSPIVNELYRINRSSIRQTFAQSSQPPESLKANPASHLGVWLVV